MSTLQVPSQFQAPKKKILVGGYDNHGSTTTVAIARATAAPLDQLIVKFPDTSPENVGKLLYSMDLYNTDITLVDIAINVKDPNSYINMLSLIANNNDVTVIDHHESNLKYLSMVPKNVRFLQFPSAAEMAKAVANMYNAHNDMPLLIIGVIGDRDSSVKQLVDVESREFARLYTFANAYDVMIRANLQEAVKGIYAEGIAYIERQAQNIQYPPAAIADQLMSSVKRYDNIIYVEFTPQSNASMWIWKTFDEILRRTGADYLVSVSKVLDRQLNQLVDAIFVVKYWLSDSPSPKPLLSNIIQGRKVIGHDDGFSISATSETDARQLAQQVISALQSNFSSSVSLIPAERVARSLQSDFNKILERLTQILEQQQKQYAEYLDLKREQVELLKKVDSSAHKAD